jgi:hypothetical protein
MLNTDEVTIFSFFGCKIPFQNDFKVLSRVALVMGGHVRPLVYP